MKIALVHDYLVSNGGAEQYLRALLEVFPSAPLYTLFYNKEKFVDLRQRDVGVSFLDKVPFLKRRHDIFLPFYPWAVDSLDLGDYDLIISSSWAWSKGIKKNKTACHICYCHTPMRFAYEMRKEYLKNIPCLLRWPANMCISYAKKWDQANTSGVNYFIANCRNVQERIAKYYNRDSVIIHPPLNTGRFSLAEKNVPGKYFLVVSRMVPYKRIDIVVKAFNLLNLPLKIVGEGIELNSLKRIAGKHIEFLGYIPNESLLSLYQNCIALIFPQEEDWGITALEAQACGKPVIAYSKGGALESVVEGKTGHFFPEQVPEALAKAVKEFQELKFDPATIRDNALGYDREVFKAKIKLFIDEKYKEFSQRA